MKRFLIAALLLLLPGQLAHAQSTATVVLSCGSLPISYKVGASRPITVDINGQSCISGTINATTTEKSTAAAPSYVEGTSNPLSGDLAGNLRVLDSQVLAAIQAAIPGCGATPCPNGTIGYTSDDPCSRLTKKGAPFSLTASGQVITGTASNKTYICSIDLMSATAQNIALVEGTGSVCATNIFGLAGGTTAATGWNLAANGGLTKGAGVGTVYSPSADANALAANVCLLLSSTGQTSGQITYVTAP